MMLRIPHVLTAEELRAIRERLAAAAWVDGRVTAGHQGVKVKANQQLAEDSTDACELGAVVMRALERNGAFMSAALPRHVYPPMFNRYGEGMNFGMHIDGAIRQVADTPLRIRTDLSATLFLNETAEYDGGELLIEEADSTRSIKLPAGDLILYPATTLHRVAPVMRGERLASFFWIQSLVREESERSLLFDLDRAIIELGQTTPSESPAMLRLTAAYHNLVRKWTVT
jgi:PKHD-type hydroxylase